MASLIVVFPKAEDGKSIRNLLVRSGYSVAGVCTSGAQALNYADSLSHGIVVCGYKFPDMVYAQLRDWLPAGFDMLLVASPSVLNNVGGKDIVCLPMPIKAYDLINTVQMMDVALEKKRKKQKQKPRERNERERELIAQAKELLMNRNNMTEEEAHRYIQKRSMDNTSSMVETAQMLLTMMKE
ncbi:ANTAR domain-containing response regulator [Konateibacter massiliensis]|uniref:ANTAR domain-containing response regulator n=1 Tax=Konateibacter massiliensis TaxID=2002841 RepID=UPI000C144A92|nr:ANTAR domain-containing protein [Konateibacter massiliensis]